MPIGVIKFFRAFLYAGRGLLVAVKERNVRVHLTAMFLVVLAGLLFRINEAEWLVIILLCSAVISAEVVNTALENVCNSLRDDLGLPYKATRDARDLAAGAVLVLAIAAVIIAAIIFGPRVAMLLGY